MSEINKLASAFLEEYLSDNPHTEFHRVLSPAKRYEIHDSNETCEQFLTQIKTEPVEADRIDISETAPVMILRICPRHLPSYFAGSRRDGTLLWTHDIRLAACFYGNTAEAALNMLADRGVRARIMPVPEIKYGSL